LLTSLWVAVKAAGGSAKRAPRGTERAFRPRLKAARGRRTLGCSTQPASAACCRLVPVATSTTWKTTGMATSAAGSSSGASGASRVPPHSGANFMMPHSSAVAASVGASLTSASALARLAQLAKLPIWRPARARAEPGLGGRWGGGAAACVECAAAAHQQTHARSVKTRMLGRLPLATTTDRETDRGPACWS